jgi:hypothetical protein
MALLFFCQVPGKLELSITHMAGLGVPPQYLLRRSYRDALRQAVSDDPGWRLTGPGKNMVLSHDGLEVARVGLEGDTVAFAWDLPACSSRGWRAADLEIQEEYIRDGAEYYQGNLVGPSIRKVLDRMLGDIPGIQKTVLPGLHIVSGEGEARVRQIPELLPGVVFWGIDIPEGETPPISTGTDPEIEEEA